MKCFQLSNSLFFILLCTLSITTSGNETKTSEKIRSLERNETIDENMGVHSTRIGHTGPSVVESCPKANCSEYSTNTTINNRVTDRSCNCDENCAEYRDCCADSQYYYSEEQREPSPYEYRSYDHFRFLVKGTCPPLWKDDQIRDKCAASADYTNLNIEEVALRIPVTSLTTAIVYGNAYCSFCHWENNVKPWTVKRNYNCFPHNLDFRTNICNEKRDSTMEDLHFDGKRWYFHYNGTVQYCTLKTYPPNDMVSEYRWKTFIISSCPANWTDLGTKEKCGDAYLRVADKTNGNVYRNKYCAYCNGANDSNLSCHVVEKIDQTFQRIRPYSSFSEVFEYEESLVPLCGPNQTSSADQICVTEETRSSASENWFFNAYTSIAISVSLLFLILHLTIFTFVKELHTIGAILMYYFFLCAFTWMLTISYDLWRTFWNATKHLRSPSHPNKTFRLYSLWSWSGPLVPVSMTLYLNYSLSDSNLAPRFGEKNDTCWFQNGYSLLVFFVVPVSLTILLNFALFLHTSIMVHSSRCRSVNQKSRVDFKLFARIALLTGITWITGFIGGYTQMTAIWFIFIVLNTAQGVLIFIAFSCKKRIIHRFLKRLGVCENWQEVLQDSMTKTSDTKPSSLTNNVDGTA